MQHILPPSSSIYFLDVFSSFFSSYSINLPFLWSYLIPKPLPSMYTNVSHEFGPTFESCLWCWTRRWWGWLPLIWVAPPGTADCFVATLDSQSDDTTKELREKTQMIPTRTTNASDVARECCNLFNHYHNYYPGNRKYHLVKNSDKLSRIFNDTDDFALKHTETYSPHSKLYPQVALQLHETWMTRQKIDKTVYEKVTLRSRDQSCHWTS